MNENDLLLPLLRTWAKMVGEHPIASPWTPWWLDPSAQLQAITRVAETLGWQPQSDVAEEWDLHFTTLPGAHLLVRCMGAGVDLSPEGAYGDVIADSWRVLALTPPPPLGTVGVHLVVVAPYLAQAGEEAGIRARVEAWRAAHPWPGTLAWVDAPVPIPRNEVGTAFPGQGLLARIAPS